MYVYANSLIDNDVVEHVFSYWRSPIQDAYTLLYNAAISGLFSYIGESFKIHSGFNNPFFDIAGFSAEVYTDFKEFPSVHFERKGVMLVVDPGGTLNKYYIFISLLSFPKNTVPFFYF